MWLVQVKNEWNLLGKNEEKQKATDLHRSQQWDESMQLVNDFIIKSLFQGRRSYLKLLIWS